MVKKSELDYYNKEDVWKKYDNNKKEVNRAKKIVNLIPSDVKSVIDIGCGNGIITNMIKKPFVVGLDFAKIPLTNVKTNAIQASIDNLPLQNVKIDLIILTEVIEHLDNKTYLKAIKEIKRLKGNYILITVPFNENIELGLCKCSVCGNLFHSSHHYRKFNTSWFKLEFPEYKLEKLTYATYITPPNEKIIKLKKKYGGYTYSNVAACNKCGNKPIRPNLLLRCIFGGLYHLDLAKKKILKKQKPYHQIVLLKRNVES